MSSLLYFMQTERAPLTWAELVSSIRPMAHDTGFPSSEPQLRRELTALQDAGLAECDVVDDDEVWRIVPERLPIIPQQQELFA